MRSASRLAPIGAWLCLLSLSGCTTLSSGVVVSPPGIGRYAFRECLLDRGFYSPQALTGIALRDHTPPPAPPTRQSLLDQSPPVFAARAAAIIAGGLMPALEFDPAAPDASGRNAPYVELVGSAPTRTDWRLNRFLDCYIAPVGAASLPTTLTEDDDSEGRLLRAHILLVLLARFGAELVVTHAGDRQTAQAAMLLDHLLDAERDLRTASAIMTPGAMLDADGLLTVTDPAGTVRPTLRWRAYTTRLLRILQVGLDDERIDARQSIERAGNLVAAFHGPATGLLPLLEDSLAGAITAQEIRLYGDAYLRDARETLAMTRNATTAGDHSFTYRVAAFQQGWQNWDIELARACTTLASIAGKDEAICGLPNGRTAGDH